MQERDPSTITTEVNNKIGQRPFSGLENE